MRKRLTLQLYFLVLLAGCPDPGGTDLPERPGGQEDPSPPDSGSKSLPDSCVNTFTADESLPELLSQTGLYADIQSKEIHEVVQAFTPEFQLWSDDAEKSRWVYVPECDTVDTSDMNDWSFPVGTRFFKEFMVGVHRIETRLIERIGVGPYDFLYASYQWNDEETEATLVPKEGILNVKGTTHDIPSQAQCRRCHGSHEEKGGRPSRALGFSAFQLNHENAGLLLNDLVTQGRLSHAPDQVLQVPGDDIAKAALGYLHMNCGVCHNGTRDGVPQTDMNLWVDVGQNTVEETSAYLTAVGKANKIFNDQHVTARIEPGVPDTSAIIYRMSQRGNNAQMPPLASKQVDETGIATVKAWILSLP